MYHTIITVKIQSILLLLLTLSTSAAWAQNPTVSLSGSSCIPSTLQVSSSATPTQVIIYQNGSVVNTSTSTSYLASTAGTYYAGVTTATGSAFTNSVTVAGPTTPTISISAIPSSNIICAGANISFNVAITNSGTAPIYQWKKNGANVATGPTYTTNALVNGDAVSCVLTSNTACATANTVTSNTITYTVTTPVTPSVSITSYPAGIICSGTAANFVAAAVNGGTTPSYQWYVNSNFMLTTSVDSFTISTLNNNDTVYCKMVTSVPCATVETVTSNKIAISVSPSAVPAVIITANPGTVICAGAQVTFSATGTNGGTNAQYQWIMDGTAVPGATSATYTPAALASNDSVRVIMTSNAICAYPALVSSNELTVIVNPTGTPSITISTPGGSSYCISDTAIFTAVTTFGGTAPLYTWFKNGSIVAGPGIANSFSATGINTNDTISAILTSNQVCATGTTANSNKLGFTAYPHLTMTLSIAANPGTNIKAGDVVTFTATAASTGNAFTYQWYVNGTIKTGSISPTYSTNTLANNDVVTCKVTSATPCVSNPVITSNALTISVANGVAGVIKGAIQAALYPNPNNGNFIIKGTVADYAKEVIVEIWNLTGQLIYNNTIQVHNSSIDTLVNLPVYIPSGVYQLKLKTSNTNTSLKFILTK
jgi:hypothetical protein